MSKKNKTIRAKLFAPESGLGAERTDEEKADKELEFPEPISPVSK